MFQTIMNILPVRTRIWKAHNIRRVIQAAIIAAAFRMLRMQTEIPCRLIRTARRTKMITFAPCGPATSARDYDDVCQCVHNRQIETR